MLSEIDYVCPVVCPEKYRNNQFTTALYQNAMLPWIGKEEDFYQFYDDTEKRRIQIKAETLAEKKIRQASTEDISMKGVPQILMGVERTKFEEPLDEEEEFYDSDETITD